jgi:predicted O-methyltransferase YrrM
MKKNSMESIFKLAEQIKGFLDPDEGRRLYDIACEAVRMGPCLEVGSYCGKSTVYLGQACRRHGAVLFSIDHHRGSEEQQPGERYFDPSLFNTESWAVETFGWFRRTLGLAELEDVVVPLVCASATAAKAWAISLSLVFIDGGHAYETVLADYLNWSRHILPGGYLLIHDIFEDPSQGGQAPYLVYQHALASGNFEALPMTRTLGVLVRKDAGT